MRIDAHQHFWIKDPVQYPWIPAGSPLDQVWLPEDLAQLQPPLGFGGSIAVQARQSVEESRWLLELAARNPLIRGVVGWVDLQSPDCDEDLARLALDPRFVGVRHVVQDEPDDEFLLKPEFVRGISRLNSHGLAYDLLIYPRQLPAAIRLVNRFPEQRFVLDHIAKPPIASGNISPWREQMEELALMPNVYCKVSGMVTEADHQNWKPEHFLPYLDVVFESFGLNRLMFGSDWPVCLLAAEYDQVLSIVSDYASGLDSHEMNQLLGGNAARFYQLPLAGDSSDSNH